MKEEFVRKKYDKEMQREKNIIRSRETGRWCGFVSERERECVADFYAYHMEQIECIDDS